MHRPFERTCTAAAAILLAACGGASSPACSVSSTAGADWQPVAAAGVSLRLPPGYAPDRSAPPPPNADGTYLAWTAGARGQLAGSSRVALVVGSTVPSAELMEVEGGGGPHDVQRCTLPTAGRSADVSTAWFVDSTSATGRSYQTIARWDSLSGGRSAALVMVGETPSEQARHLAAASTVRIP